MIQITEEALTHMRGLIARQDDPSIAGIRLAVLAGGCSGLSYSLDFEKDTDPEDRVFGGEPKVFVDPASLDHLAGLTLHFDGGLNGKGLIFDNPKATDTCGCGTSFSTRPKAAP